MDKWIKVSCKSESLQDHRRWTWHCRLLDYQMRTFIWNYFWISKDFGIIRFFWIIHGHNEGDEGAERAKGDKGAEGAEGA